MHMLADSAISITIIICKTISHRTRGPRPSPVNRALSNLLKVNFKLIRDQVLKLLFNTQVLILCLKGLALSAEATP